MRLTDATVETKHGTKEMLQKLPSYCTSQAHKHALCLSHLLASTYEKSFDMTSSFPYGKAAGHTIIGPIHPVLELVQVPLLPVSILLEQGLRVRAPSASQQGQNGCTPGQAKLCSIHFAAV